MYINILQNNKASLLSIDCTVKGRQALHSDEMTARERQFILLLDKDSQVSEQAVKLLINKVDLRYLASKGWITYQFADKYSQGREMARAAQYIVPPSTENKVIHIDSLTETITMPKSKRDSKNLKNFLDTYASKPAETMTADDKHATLEASLTQYAITVASMNQNEPMNDIFEDIVIVQSLLE